MEPIYSRTVPPCNYIRTSDFSLRDLSIFVDSMETISKIERERHERRQRRRNNKLKVKSTIAVAEVHATPIRILNGETAEVSSEEENIVKPVRVKLFGSKNKLTPVPSSSDENYFSGASESSEGNVQNNTNEEQKAMEITTISNNGDSIATLPADSGTESESAAPFQLRPRSYAMTNPKYRTTRARIIGLVLKREYANGGSHDDEFEQQERRERVLEGLLREKKQQKKNKNKCESLRSASSLAMSSLLSSSSSTVSSSSTKKSSIILRTQVSCSKAQKQPSAEMRFIDKALRYLTL